MDPGLKHVLGPQKTAQVLVKLRTTFKRSRAENFPAAARLILKYCNLGYNLTRVFPSNTP